MYFELIDLKYAKAELIVRLANYVEGKPDGYVGLPLVLDSRSKLYKITFKGVAEFRSTAEPCFTLEGTRRVVSDFLSEIIGSEYSNFVCPAGVGPKEKPHHFCVYTETIVLEVLAVDKPEIEVTEYSKEIEP